jgi:hypothetical protein
MLCVTVYASLDRSIFSVGPPLTTDPWFHATLVDAYCGFITFFAWVAYKEKTLVRRLFWLVVIMTLGNIAMSIYVLNQLVRIDRLGGLESILLRNPGRSGSSHQD